MRPGVLSRLLLLLCSPFAVLCCAHASTVVQIVDAIIPDLLPTFSSEAFTPKYIVAVQNGKTQDVGLEGVLPMKDKYGRPYSCVIPDAITPDTQAQRASSLKDDEQNMQKDPSELLSALDSLCLYRIEDWWTYELCYKKHVRQFHKDAENAMSEYDLGQYDVDRSDLDTILDNGTLTGASSKYVRQVYAGGEACDITGKLRETEVHFVCSEEGKEGIKSIREHATCQYTLVFATSQLCKHPGFQIPKQPVHTIVCSRPGGSQQADSTVPAQPQEMDQESEGKDSVASSESMKGDAPVVQDETGLAEILDLTGALQGNGLNVSAFEAASADSERGVEAEADQSGGRGQQERRNSAGTEGSEAGKPSTDSRGAEDAGKRDRKSTAPKASGAVGPPSAAGSGLAERELYYEDNGVDEEADLELLEEEDDEVDFSRTGMHAEL
ncbi:g12505 [Coccomyxa viridis]|uniref:G12505 protein n=1 Tax=Coccomyxa viridis TaxID=1274662 RepID=A0ABP1GBJ1_9CHLO